MSAHPVLRPAVLCGAGVIETNLACVAGGIITSRCTSWFKGTHCLSARGRPAPATLVTMGTLDPRRRIPSGPAWRPTVSATATPAFCTVPRCARSPNHNRFCPALPPLTPYQAGHVGTRAPFAACKGLLCCAEAELPESELPQVTAVQVDREFCAPLQRCAHQSLDHACRFCPSGILPQHKRAPNVWIPRLSRVFACVGPVGPYTDLNFCV